MDDLCLTIVMNVNMMVMALLDNIMVEDVARLFVGDGITIPQISDMYEWGQTALLGWSQG